MRGILFILSAFCAIASLGQGTVYTNYGFTPLEINPALLSSTDQYQLQYAFRKFHLSGASGLQTNSITLSTPISLGQRPFGGAGIAFYHDQLDNTETFYQTKIQGGLAYDIQLAKNQTLSGGLGVTYGMYDFSLEGLSTGSQYVRNSGFSPDLSSGEEFQSQQESYFSISPGFLWSIRDIANFSQFNLGIGIADVTEPVVNFAGSESPIPRSWNIHGGFGLALSERLSLETQLLYRSLESIDLFNTGVRLTYTIDRSNEANVFSVNMVGFGLNYIDEYALAPGVFLGNQTYNIGASFDISTGNAAVPANATEIYLRVSFGKRSGQRKTQVVSDYSVKQIRKFYDDPEPVYVNKETENQQGKADDNYSSKSDYRFQLSEDFKFAFNQAELNEASKKYLDNLAELLKGNKKLNLDVIGHSDDVGTAEANEIVSQRRADAVKDYLVSIGISGKRINTVAKGATDPLVPNVTEANRSLNRRVEFLIYE